MILIIGIAAFLLGIVMSWLIVKSRSGSLIATLQANLENQARQMAQMDRQQEEWKDREAALRGELSQVLADKIRIGAKYEESLNAIEEQKKFVGETQKALKDSFDALSAADPDGRKDQFPGDKAGRRLWPDQHLAGPDEAEHDGPG